MSAPTTIDNDSTSSTENVMPWQYKWKRPRISQIKSTTSDIQQQIADKIPISTASARLKSDEIRLILQRQQDDNNKRQKRQSPIIENNNMKWEDLESESEEEEEDDNNNNNEEEKEVEGMESNTTKDNRMEFIDDDDGYIVTVTTFASRYSLEIMQKAKDDDITVPADAILFEVMRDLQHHHHHHQQPQRSNSENESDHNDHDQIERDIVETMFSKLLYWPSSALIDTNIEGLDDAIGEKSNYLSKKNAGESDLVMRDDENGDDVVVTNMNDDPADNNKIRRELLKMWNNVRSAMQFLPLSEMTSAQRRMYVQRQIRHQVSLIKRKAGVKDIDLFRPSSIRENDKNLDVDMDMDMDDAMDVLERMTLGMGLEFDHDLVADVVGERESIIHHEDDCEENRELMLSCLCNDNQVYIFSLMELLCPEEDVELLKGNESKFIGAMTGEGSTNDTLISGFEALLLGQDLAHSLQNTFLPLSKPKAVVDLTISSIKGRINKEEGGDTDMSHEQIPVNVENVGVDLEGFRPHIELSLLDANIESSTMHNRTMNNTPTICISAFSYIAIGGKGMRKYRRMNKHKPSEGSDQPRIIWENLILPGGFVSLISTKYYTETRTIFLPFEPKLISPVYWHSAQLLIVTGATTDQCVAIRTDSSSYVTISRQKFHNEEGFRPGSGLLKRLPKMKRQFIKKFSPIRISFGDDDSNSYPKAVPISISSMSVTPPNILLCMVEDDVLDVRLFSLDSFEPNYRQDGRQSNLSLLTGPRYPNDVMRTKNDPRHHMQLSPTNHFDISMEKLIQSEYSSVDQKDIVRCISGQGWSIIGLKVLDKLGLFHISWEGAVEPEGAFYKHIDTIEYQQHLKFYKIPGICKNVVIEPPQNSIGSGNNRIGLTPLRFGRPDDMNLLLSMRMNAVSNEATSPVQMVLDWLCEEKDYFTAASIALHLLGDLETIEDLQRTSVSCRQHREGLLDGITPLDIADMQKVIRSDSSNRTQISMSSVMTYEEALHQQTCITLSNMALSCLVNAGSTMSQTLDKFLGRNDFYDASIACQKLVDTSTHIIEALNARDMKHLAPYSYDPLHSDGHSLWALQGLLRVAVTRECMDTALRMLNDNIPDELRHRPRRGSPQSNENVYRSSLALSKSIISMILAASDQSASALMKLVESGTNRLYWESLDHETRMSLCLIHVQGRYPMLREREVREWVLELLNISTGLVDRGDVESIEALVPSDWLRELCTASLGNAGCDLSQTILFTPIISLSDDSADQDGSDILQRHQEDEDDLYDYLSPAPGCGGIDFDHLIPALLLLESRNDHWVGNDSVSSQSILNIACDMAGRHSLEEPKFAFDSVSVMKQCVLMDNVLAAANLIGGRNGLVLKCAHVLIEQGGLTMDQAEDYLLLDGETTTNAEPLRKEAINNGIQEDDNNERNQFVLTEGHKSLLLLLEKHVLSVKKFGDFHSKSRGQIDPVFATRICLRTWVFMMKAYPLSGQWLETWFNERLQLGTDDQASRRLSCAAIIRALLWSESASGEMEEDDLEKKPVLAMSLGFSMHFLVNLARVPCGLLECIPTKRAEVMLK